MNVTPLLILNNYSSNYFQKQNTKISSGSHRSVLSFKATINPELNKNISETFQRITRSNNLSDKSAEELLKLLKEFATTIGIFEVVEHCKNGEKEQPIIDLPNNRAVEAYRKDFQENLKLPNREEVLQFARTHSYEEVEEYIYKTIGGNVRVGRRHDLPSYYCGEPYYYKFDFFTDKQKQEIDSLIKDAKREFNRRGLDGKKFNVY